MKNIWFFHNFFLTPLNYNTKYDKNLRKFRTWTGYFRKRSDHASKQVSLVLFNLCHNQKQVAHMNYLLSLKS